VTGFTRKTGVFFAYGVDDSEFSPVLYSYSYSCQWQLSLNYLTATAYLNYEYEPQQSFMISCYLVMLNQSLTQYLSFYDTEFNNSKVDQIDTE